MIKLNELTKKEQETILKDSFLFNARIAEISFRKATIIVDFAGKDFFNRVT